MKVLKARDELVYQSALLSSVSAEEMFYLTKNDANDVFLASIGAGTHF